MRTRSRFALLFACICLAVMAIGVVAIYEALGRDNARRVPLEAESILAAAARKAVDPAAPTAARLKEATESLMAARSLLAESRILGKDAVVRLAIEVAAILGAVLAAASLAFLVLSRLITRGLDELAAGALVSQGDLRRGDRPRRFRRSQDPDLDAVASALNELLDLAAEQERKLEAAAKLEGWREVASFLAHQLKNPLAAVLLAARNGSMALEEEEKRVLPPGILAGMEAGESALAREGLARESLRIIQAEAERLHGLLDRFRDLAPAGLDAYGKPEDFDLISLLEDCAARAERSGASVRIVGPAAALVRGDRGLAEQVFWNLFSNSIEAAGGSGASVRIEASVAGRDREAVTLVLDSNRGFDSSLIPRLGLERVSTKSSGTGLGLILVRRILAAQGGSLELFATREGGLGAKVSMPLARRSG